MITIISYAAAVLVGGIIGAMIYRNNPQLSSKFDKLDEKLADLQDKIEELKK